MSTRCSRPPTSRASRRAAGGRRGRLPGRAVRRRAGRRRCPRPTRCSASTTTPTSRPGCARSWRGSSTHPHTPQDRRRLLPISPVDRQSERPTGRPVAPRDPAGAGPMAPLKLASRLRPAVHVLRDPVVPRLVREPAAHRGPRRGPVAGRRRGPRAVPRQRELHVLRQGPRRPPAPRDAAAGAGRDRRQSNGSGSPTSSRPRSGPGCSRRSRPRRAWRRTSTSPSSTPATRCCAGCAGSVTRRASWACSTGSGRWRRRPGSAPT